MATLRRGLPRTPGGDAWPPAGVVASDALAPADAASGDERSVAADSAAPSAPAAGGSPSAASVVTSVGEDVAPKAAEQATTVSASADRLREGSGAAAGGSPLRRGLPRVSGGEPWPPAGVAVPGGAASVPAPVVQADAARTAEAPQASSSAPAATPAAPAASAPDLPSAERATAPGTSLRRGLPRVAGGDPWPPAGSVRASTAPAAVSEVLEQAAPGAPSAAPIPEPATAEPAAAQAATSAVAPAVVPRPDVSAPLPFTRTVWNGSAPRRVSAEPAPSKLRPTWPQAIGGLFAAAGLAVLAGAAIAIVRAFLSLPFMQDFLTTYPGEYHLPAGAPVGLPAWIGWQHFFNVFLMTLIIRSGLRVRSEKRPTAFWTPRGNPKGKISLTLWFHQGLDLLWILNGVVFIVLLFVTGQWMRLVPTSWEVFPNALSAALQYVSFDWPTENGWVNYNSLQQLAYFTVVFLAAPVAIATGFRMSGLWPKKAEGLSKAYPIEVARALHFPTMLFFVAFIVVHVALVLLTGMLRNLNHMFAAQDAVTWTGFWVFLLSLAVIAGGWIAARPLVLAPIAKLFGQVSGR
ncbi:cytochrome b/b6 domain-containing protein [Microbacterium azadirachtae]|uniref:cytochrome b/b6 domain-containing protein n=1 Tax=Microbacterium azadirachtae TaxID=582680 RepID=UPI000881EF64|nr:cytochrome b/b6 domain-containing protein [Microbacterium azadirachtae]SDM16238.1 Thiosulfate reductase cytochrome b subunit [Microbacterium azadirachtae]SEG39527.1 Thiosulfate reductase cytochrome b subunit [Microbacterium azadirachtae]SEG42611.1 Thiosulfate reductase cytochrome b subunit [Microbacterium azadirachtae]